MRMLLCAAFCLSSSGCVYRLGQGLIAGALDEVGGKGRTGGVGGTADLLLEREVLTELGHQLGQGLTSGATEIDPEQQARLEQTIEDLITVATRRAGKGLRNEVSPELREMVQKDIVQALSEGLRGELGNSLEETVDRVISRAVLSLRTSLVDEEMRMALSDLLRDSMYYAMREGGTTPAVGEVLESTLTENMLIPIEESVGGIRDGVALEVEASYRRTENTLRMMIGALIVITSVIGMLYFIRNRQVRRLEEQNVATSRGLRNFDAALAHLDPEARATIQAKLDEYQAVEARPMPFVPRVLTPPPAPTRSDDYQRRG